MLAQVAVTNPRWQAAGYTALGLLAGAAVGAAFAHDVTLGAAAGAALVIVAALLVRPVVLGIAALAAVFASYRLGTAVLGSGISYSDAVLGVASALALLRMAGAAEVRRLRLPLAGIALYLVALLPTVLFNPSHRAYLEWGHRLVLVGGSLVVGAWIVHEQAVRPALRALVAVTAVVASAAVFDTLATGFGPASPFGLNKNLVGALLGLVVIVVVVAPQHLAVTPGLRIAVVVVTAAGLVSSQSRGGMLGAAAGLLLAYALDPRSHSRASKALALVATAVFAGFVFFSVNRELNQTKAQIANSSIGVRINVERVTREIWQTSPAYGVGLKYFVTGGYGPNAQAANNVVDNELAESGVIGLIGFVLFQGASVWAGIRRRRGDPLTVAAVCCVAGQLVHGMVDIYWTAGVASLPFLLLGLGLAAQPAGKSSASTRSSTRVHS